MPISGTYAAGNYDPVNSQVIGLDIGATATYVAVETWVTDIRFTRNERPTAELVTHGGINETATGALPNADIEIDFIYDAASTAPYFNLVEILEGANQTCNIKESPNSLTAPTSGDITREVTACKIVSITEPNFDANVDGEVPTFTATFSGSLATTQAP